MNCQKIMNLLSAYVDGELDGHEHRQIFEHLKQCASCREEHDGIVEMKRLLSRLRTKEPSTRLSKQIHQSLNLQQKNNSSDVAGRGRIYLQRWLTAPVPQGLVLGAGAAVLIIMFVTMRPSGPGIEWSTRQPGDLVAPSGSASKVDVQAGLSPLTFPGISFPGSFSGTRQRRMPVNLPMVAVGRVDIHDVHPPSTPYSISSFRAPYIRHH